ncbi:hypothetical protein HOG21_03020 [bacterium]|nr:hypothetical protein [bacterium]
MAVKISGANHISINSHSISKVLKGNDSANSLIASVISYSPLDDFSILFTISSILGSNLYTHRLAKYHTKSFGFSITFFTFFSKSNSNIQYFEGFFTFLTSTQYQLNFNNFFKSSFSKILSPFITNTSISDSNHFKAAPVHFSSHCT